MQLRLDRPIECIPEKGIISDIFKHLCMLGVPAITVKHELCAEFNEERYGPFLVPISERMTGVVMKQDVAE
ncbi:hypothetical protein DY245_42900 [Streptomyces inhibens]|uniref:Uncharacterized protein n=1 Tax=Streptomyces inhibens TaxID=2293571 RepID=A0A371PQB2_STRIH|nr:hypothetical protein DY245_42900 [Streptomyces inhibens]